MPQPDRLRFITKLQEQITFLQRSCILFDNRAHDEGLRMATALRIMFWDKGRNVSLLSHLKLRDGYMLSTSRGHGDYKDYLQYILNFSSSIPVSTLPMLGDKFRAITFNEWWCHESVFVHDGQKYSRQRIVLSAAHKDGGAHVDKELEDFYEVLSSGRFGFGLKGNFTYAGPPPFEQNVTQYAPNAHLSLLRQFSHETLASAQQFNWLQNGV
jgi:hypothetical protein